MNNIKQLQLKTTKSKEPKLNSLLIIKDGQDASSMSLAQIFNSKKYDTFNGVTYSTSASFINKYITPFKHINLTKGLNGNLSNNSIYKTLSDVNKNEFNYLKQNIKHGTVNLYQGLSNYAKQLLNAHTFQLRRPSAKVIHCKFYLLSNSKTHSNRIIVGSANLSNNAFVKNHQFEDILIFDNSSLFSKFEHYYKSNIIPTTAPYFPKSLMHLTNSKLRKSHKNRDNNDKKSKIKDTILLSPSEADEVEKSSYTDDPTILHHEITLGLIAPQDLDQMKEIKSKASTVSKQEQKDANINKTVLEMQSEYVNPRTKRPKFKKKPALSHAFVKHIHVQKVKDVGKGIPKRQANIVSLPMQRNKSKTGLFTINNNKRMIPFGQPLLDKKVLRQGLDNIQNLINSYNQFSINDTLNNDKRIMEAILYTMEAPFLYEIRQKAREQPNTSIEAQEIPQFLIIGGAPGSGKSHLLKIIMKLMGIYKTTNPQLFNQVIPSDVRTKKSLTIKQLRAWINTQNVAPLIIDEIAPWFFTNPNYGENMIVEETNLSDSNDTRAFPALIGATNTNEYTLPKRGSRRTYYLKIDKPFDSRFRKQSNKTYKKIYDNTNPAIFYDFTTRMSKMLQSHSNKYWIHYSKNGLYDFLYPARIIFEHYYKMCGLPTPKFLSRNICNDSSETGKEKWQKLYINSPEYFKEDKLNKNILTIDISLLDNNSNKFGIKPSQVYKNDLSLRVTPRGKDGKIIELDKKAFFKWLNINPKHSWWKRIF